MKGRENPMAKKSQTTEPVEVTEIVLSADESIAAEMSEQVSAAAEVGAHVPDSATLNAIGAAKKAAAKAAKPAKNGTPAPAPKPAPKPSAKVETPVASTPDAGKGRSFVLITLRERDAINEDGPKAIQTLIADGVDVRVENGKERPASIPTILPQYYSRWRVRLALTTAQAEKLAEYLDRPLDGEVAVESKPAKGTRSGGSSNGSPLEDETKAAIRKAQAMVKEVDAMNAHDALAIVGTDEYQAAIELAGKASLGVDAF